MRVLISVNAEGANSDLERADLILVTFPGISGGVVGIWLPNIAPVLMQCCQSGKPEVKAWVLHTSNYCRECCAEAALFSQKNGQPYPEVHHFKRLVDGGSNIVTNAIALCPNCHRKLHHGEGAEQLVERLCSANCVEYLRSAQNVALPM
jgi:hypothetical protein